MNYDIIREYCLQKKATTFDFPFDEEVMACRVAGKIFVLMSIFQFPVSINVKCDPEKAIDLRERYDAVKPGYHMNKIHWNTVICDGSLTDAIIFSFIDHSYEMVVQSLPKKVRNQLQLF
ncbi:MAG TPA: MmcQ/YjbR family DNA-binding protein [Candidatus Kapabacteria bacterium]|jgi:predicted DNA-binding protein (MmcQ/YjbR family)|nr:MmcQ/YjbR family DNA-binding protein [Ignavibacteria bacterium]HRE57775.1 MmcQ/YjbR family DNA-binding protein [Candidatus Kapabacteria bacterium]HRK59955.1 MmcQ/YjbR family DNA-binding protein [Candidatus Kapabacteria bacterium]